MWDVSGIDGAAPAWLEIVNALHEGEPSAPPAPPPGRCARRRRVVDRRHRARAGEWWIAGTEPAAGLVAAAPRLARILSPAPDQRIALDPDIPRARERVLLQVDPPGATLVWTLDGTPLGSAAAPRLWAPVRGHHELVLEDEAGRTVDSVRFVVR